MPLSPHHISFSTKTWSPIHRDSPTDYVSTIRIDILYGEEREVIGQGLGGLLALSIAVRFDDRDIVALKPWPMTADDPENVAGAWELPSALIAQADRKRHST